MTGDRDLIISPYELAELAILKAVTNLHPGVGRAGETVDLPVQKDNLGFPIIYSSSLKGALKSAMWHSSNLARIFFGPEPEEGEKFTSAVAITDCITVAFPVRSLEGVYAFATSPLLLKRLNEFVEMIGKDGEEMYKCVRELSRKPISEGQCLISKGAEGNLKIEALGDRILINEEIDVKYEVDQSGNIEKLEELLDIDRGRLVLLNDNDASRALKRSLVRVARIAIDRERKTVKRGALWTEEYVPWGTVFATVFLYSKARKSDSDLQEASKVREKFHELLKGTRYYLIIGGDETVGRGIVRLEFK